MNGDLRKDGQSLEPECPGKLLSKSPLMLCPICQKKVQATDPFMPFCSDRCKTVDLGNWAMEKYVISEPVLLEDFNPEEEE
ncbi:MAG: DNA gyrase inhibitor YacG [Bryobacteraceae bacterium]